MWAASAAFIGIFSDGQHQAAAALAALTDGQRVSVLNAPAGSGKTRVLAEAARARAAAGLGPVIGITPSQSARNTLAAGVPVSCNTAQFLGHLPGQRGARGPVRLRPGDLVLIDEASMVSNPDLADVVERELAAIVTSFLAGQGLTVDDIGTWMAHPGGPKVIDAVQHSLKLPDNAVAVSRRSLAEVGNLSSASVLHVMEMTQSHCPHPPGSYGMMIGLGPGVSVELILLHW